MEVAFLTLLIGALSASSSDALCVGSGVKHPQQHFCDADFAMKLTRISEVSDSDLSGYTLYNAEILRSWKRGPGSGRLQFYVPAVAIYGVTFTSGMTYVVTGTRKRTSDGRKYWLHESCDYMIAWDDMSAQQRAGFEMEYAAQCEECEVPTAFVAEAVRVDDMDNNHYIMAMTYWTPTGCYYNPLKTGQYVQKGIDIKDCEYVYGLCQRNRAGGCHWKMTADYNNCFQHRDDLVFADSAVIDVTDVSQCVLFTNKRKRRTCRKRFREVQAQQGANEEELF